MKIIQIVVAHTQPYTQPNGDFCWGLTELFGLGDDGAVYLCQIGYGGWKEVISSEPDPPAPKEK